jgi:Gram-negative bacterial TonB protein C-terminal
MSIHSLIQLPEDLHPGLAVSNGAPGIEGGRAELLELRTESGTRYVCPSGWQRLRLRWIFRHFRVLPSPVLSRSDQRLIEKLSRSSLVTPPLPVPESAILGVVEEPSRRPTKPTYPAAAAAKEAIKLQPVPQAIQAAEPFADREFRGPGAARWWQFVALGTIACACAVAGMLVLPAWTHRGSTPVAAPMANTRVSSTPQMQAPVQVAEPVVSSTTIEQRKHRVLPLADLSTALGSETFPALPAAHPASVVVAEPVAEAAPGGGDSMVLSHLPPGHLVKPVVTDPNRTGNLRLKALIGPDGSVKDVTVLSGDPQLAEAAVRAVRQWHYSQYAAQGHAGDAEALIGMSVFGPDAISITSLAR